MRRHCVSAAIAGLLLVVTAGAAPAQKPQPVPRLVDRHLDHASYVELAKQWKTYIEENGESVDALVNLGMAYDYSDEHEAALVAARRAVELGPDNPTALSFLGKMLAVFEENDDEALKLLEHCREVAPDYEPGITNLAATYLRRGELDEADAVMKTLFEQRVIPRPLQDYAWNMLVGLPEGAVLITSGDNDTFPPLALQAGMDFRSDVVVINRSLLNLPAYAESVFTRHPDIRPDYNIEEHETKQVDGRARTLSVALIGAMIEEQKAPICITASCLGPDPLIDPEGHMEGINLRAGKKGMSGEESARLFLDTYRLDSATDWDYAWSLKPSVAHLLRNYGSAAVRLIRDDGLKQETKGRLLDKVEAIAEFHDDARMQQVVSAMRKQ